MHRVLITGASGFVGRNLCRHLCDRGFEVHGLARSAGSERQVTEAGGIAQPGSLQDVASLRKAMAGCDAVVHAAAYVNDWGPWATFQEINIEGTGNVLRAARASGIERLVHVGTEAVLVGGPPLVNADETWPYPRRPAGPYCRSKAIAEQMVLAANSLQLQTVVVRPRLVWGAGDTLVLPQFLDVIRHGQFAWISKGRYLTSTVHVENLAEGIRLALTDGHPGEIYFLTDEEPIEFREFLTAMVKTQGLDPGTRSVPWWLARIFASLSEAAWTFLPLSGRPPLTRFSLRGIGETVTVRDDKARRELGYTASVTLQQGLAAMAQAGQAVDATAEAGAPQ